MSTVFTAFLLTLGSAAVFVFGNPYYNVFPTNHNQVYMAVLTAAFLLITLLLRRMSSNGAYTRSAYALAMASAATLLLNTGIFNLPFEQFAGLKNLAIDKFSQFLHVVPVILAMVLLARWKLKDVYFQPGNLKAGLRFGLSWLFLFAAAAWLLEIRPGGTEPAMLRQLPWLLLFVFYQCADGGALVPGCFPAFL